MDRFTTLLNKCSDDEIKLFFNEKPLVTFCVGGYILRLVHPTQNVTTMIFLRKIFFLINFTNGKDGPSSNAHSRHIFIILRFFFTFFPAWLHFAAARSHGNMIFFFGRFQVLLFRILTSQEEK